MHGDAFLTTQSRSKARKTLRSLSEHPGTYDNLVKLIDRMRKDRLPHREDRGVVLMATAHVEQLLEDTIICRMTDEFVDGEWRGRVFGGEQRGAIDGFSGKIVIAFALGLITERVREDLQTLRRLRNVFAHSPRPIDFSHPEVIAVCQFYCVDYVDEKPAEDRSNWTPRLKFSWLLFYLFAHLSWHEETYAEGPDRLTAGLLPGAPIVDLDKTLRGILRQEIMDDQQTGKKTPRSSTRKKLPFHRLWNFLYRRLIMTDEEKIKTQNIAEAVKAATVAIALHHPDMREKKDRPFTILGSGFCIDSKGVIVTCKHVLDGFIDPDNRQPHVIFYHPKLPGRPELYMHVVPVWQSAWDEKRSSSEEAFDLAVLKIAPPTEGYKGGYPSLPIACYEDLYEMMDAVTCGFPLGDYLADEVGTLTSSFSKAMISSIMPWPGVTQDKLRGFQLDLRVAKGNSGGPVFSLISGHVFGVLKGGIERDGVQLLARAEPVYPIFTHGLVEQLWQEPSPADPSEAT